MWIGSWESFKRNGCGAHWSVPPQSSWTGMIQFGNLLASSQCGQPGVRTGVCPSSSDDGSTIGPASPLIACRKSSGCRRLLFLTMVIRGHFPPSLCGLVFVIYVRKRTSTALRNGDIVHVGEEGRGEKVTCVLAQSLALTQACLGEPHALFLEGPKAPILLVQPKKKGGIRPPGLGSVFLLKKNSGYIEAVCALDISFGAWLLSSNSGEPRCPANHLAHPRQLGRR